MLRSLSVPILSELPAGLAVLCQYVRSYSVAAQTFPFDKLLVANRGEIACRIIRTAKRLGLKTVAVYSDPDRNSMHVAQADERVRIVHPGYGFLSENYAFVERLEKEGIIFVGPSASAIRSLGDKIESKIIAKAAGVSTVPGWVGSVQNPQHAARIAAEIGYPVMIKASAGGGGKGMRLVWDEKSLLEELPRAQAEAAASFKNDALLVERYVDRARHIEFQVLGDTHGTVLWLPERDCSVQRRNQKVIEESPSPFITPEVRHKMGEQAAALARAVGYTSTGTVEFVVDQNSNFFFLEMNTRLQVEHPVTEAVTGLDLVEMMLRVAAGQKLPITQQQACSINGWAVESRVYAENPARNFLPAPGQLKHYVQPQGSTIRIDTGVQEGSTISMHYDPMISKVVTHGVDRRAALGAMSSALDRYVVRGVVHNLPLLRHVLSNPQFAGGDYDTSFLPSHYGEPGALDPRSFPLELGQQEELLAAAAFLQLQRDFALDATLLNRHREVELVVQMEGEATGCAGPQRVVLRRASASMVGSGWRDAVEVQLPGRVMQLEEVSPGEGVSAYSPHLHHLMIDGTSLHCQVIERGWRSVVLQYCGAHRKVTVDTPQAAALSHFMPDESLVDHSREVASPMTGTLVSVAVAAGAEVAVGDELAVLEAMKMRNVLRAERDGTIEEVLVKPGEIVYAEQLLIKFR